MTVMGLGLTGAAIYYYYNKKGKASVGKSM